MDVISNLKNRKIINYDRVYDIKIYASYDNFTKLRENINKYTGSVWFFE